MESSIREFNETLHEFKLEQNDTPGPLDSSSRCSG